MDQKKIGDFLKLLRKERGMTQQAFAEVIGVSNRTISRWETGSNMPDMDIVIEIADYYQVDIREILDGERKSEQMNKEIKETVLKVADYSNEERRRVTKRLHSLFVVGVFSFILYIVLDVMGLTDSGVTEDIASFALGLAFGMLIVGAIYTNTYIGKIRAFKERLLKSEE